MWGARTLSKTDPSWRYINVRRLFNMIETTIMDGTQWVVFEPNDQALWQRVNRTVSSFLLGLWRDGALFGATPDEAFFVKCDRETNPPESIDEGKLIVEVGRRTRQAGRVRDLPDQPEVARRDELIIRRTDRQLDRQAQTERSPTWQTPARARCS